MSYQACSYCSVGLDHRSNIFVLLRFQMFCAKLLLVWLCNILKNITGFKMCNCYVLLVLQTKLIATTSQWKGNLNVMKRSHVRSLMTLGIWSPLLPDHRFLSPQSFFGSLLQKLLLVISKSIDTLYFSNWICLSYQNHSPEKSLKICFRSSFDWNWVDGGRWFL